MEKGEDMETFVSIRLTAQQRMVDASSLYRRTRVVVLRMLI